MDTQTLHNLRGKFLNACCTKAEITNGILYLTFGNYLLTVMSAWRLIYETEMAVASGSKPENSTDVLKLLPGRCVEEIIVTEPFHDLTLSFSDIRLQTFADADEYEHWHIFSCSQEMVVAGPGKLWSVWVNE